MDRPPRIPIIIDTDPGIDDGIALLLALASPELEVRAVVTVYGNTTLANATRNAAEVLRLAGSSIIPSAGSDRPLVRELVTAAETHGDSGLGYAAVPRATPVRANVLALHRALSAQREPVTLVTLGPLTNLAHALNTDATLVRARVTRHLAMAGNLAAAGNTTAFSEFNAWCDPEAASVVAESGLGTEWVGLDVTRQVVMPAPTVEALGAEGRRGWLREALRFYVEFHRAYEQLDGCILNDPIILAELLRPGTLTWSDLHIRIGTGEGPERGRTQPDVTGAQARFATGIEVATVWDLLDQRVFA